MQNVVKHKVKIAGIASYVPVKVVTNLDLHTLYGSHPTWPETYLGIKKRHWTEKETTSDLATKAALELFNSSKLKKEDIDLLIVSTSTPDKLAPSTASLTAGKLGLKCPCFDINAVCSGFVYSLNVACSLIHSKQYSNILLIAAETYSTITDITSRENVYFGDGASALLLKQSTEGWICTRLYSDPDGGNGFTANIGESFKMNGKAVFNTGISNLPLAIVEILQKLNIDISEIKYLIPHQPGIKMLKSIAEQVNIPFEKVITVMDNYANVASASIPLALTYALSLNKIENNDLLLLATVGSGWTWGSGVIRWEN